MRARTLRRADWDHEESRQASASAALGAVLSRRFVVLKVWANAQGVAAANVRWAAASPDPIEPA
jgi:hypothetical protein